MTHLAPPRRQLQVLDGFDGDTPVLRPATSAATIRHLLTHTSGCGYWFGNAELARFQQLTGLPDIIESRLGALQAPLVSDRTSPACAGRALASGSGVLNTHFWVDRASGVAV